MIRDGWTTVPLEELCHFQAGSGFPKKHQGNRNGDFPVVKVSDLSLPGNGRELRTANNWISMEVARELRAKPVPPGATVFAKIGEALKAERLRLAVRPTVMDNNLMAAIPKESADAKFLYYLMGTVGLSDWAEGSALPFLRQGDLARIPVVIPIHLDEQRRIAAVLGALDDLIQSNRRVADDALRLARQLALRASEIVPLTALAVAESPRLMKPTGPFEHFSLPAYDDDGLPKVVNGETIKSGKQPLIEPVVLVSRLNPRTPRVWMAYPSKIRPAGASTEFVLLRGRPGIANEEVWALCSDERFAAQMQSRVTGTTGSHQRVDKESIPALAVSDVRTLQGVSRESLVALVREAHASRTMARTLEGQRDVLLLMLLSGRISVAEVAA